MELLKSLNNHRLIAFISASIAFLIGLAMLIYSLAQPAMTSMYSSLSAEDSTAIVARLQAMAVPYKLRTDNNQIEVPVDKVLALRMTLAQEGLPAAAQIAGYELFDKADALGTSQFVYNVNLVRALEGELARTISSLMPINSARVHLVLPKKELFTKSTVAPSASVVLKMRGAQQLTKPEIASVTHLIATAVPDLKVENITIVDDKGNPLKLSTDTGEFMFGGAVDSATEYKINMENRLTKIIEDLLSKSVGFGKVKANVSANIDFDREIINYETYDYENPVIRSQRVSAENEKDLSNQKDVSVANNIPNGPQQQLAGNSRDKGKSDTVTNYEISKRVGNKISEQGRIRNLSIAVLVDEMESLDENDKIIYTQRSEDELNKLKALAISAVGMDIERGDKIELISMRFAYGLNENDRDATFIDWAGKNSKSLIQLSVIGFIALLTLLLIVRPFVSRILEGNRELDLATIPDLGSAMAAAGIAGQNSAIAGGIAGLGEGYINQTAGGSDFDLDDEMKIHSLADSQGKPFEVVSANGVKYASVSKYLNDTVEDHLEEAVSVIKNWIYK